MADQHATIIELHRAGKSNIVIAKDINVKSGNRMVKRYQKMRDATGTFKEVVYIEHNELNRS